MQTAATCENTDNAEIAAEFYKSILDGKGFRVALYEYLDGPKAGSMFKVSSRTILIENRPCTLHGRWVEHKTYGPSFEVSFSEELKMPTKLSDFAGYLVAVKIKGVGPKTAQNIVQYFKEDTFEALKDPMLLSKVSGISKKTAKRISEEWKDREVLRPYFDLFVNMGLPVEKSTQAALKLREQGYVIEQVKENPYLLCHYEKLSFLEVDKAICQTRKDLYKSSFRIHAGAMFSMKLIEAEGHSFVKARVLLARMMSILYPREEAMEKSVEYQINEMVRNGTLIYNLGAIYRKKTFEAEKGSADLLDKLCHAPRKRVNEDRIERAIEKADPNGELSEKQREAIKKAFLYPVSIITGGPGMGKTHSLKKILEVHAYLLKEKKPYIEKENIAILAEKMVTLMAPTGRAAKTMEEKADHSASTIHHGIGLQENDEFIGQPEMLDSELVIVDEFSMVGIRLLYSLLQCISTETSLVLIGDKDQLESVSCGNVLHDLIASETIPVTILDTLFRQEAGSSIAENSQLVNHADRTEANTFQLKLDESTQFLPVSNPQECLQKLLEVSEREAGSYGISNVQILSPLRVRTDVGVKTLNTKLQEIFNPPGMRKTEIQVGARVFRTGDKIMCLKNLDEEGRHLSNGDVGICNSINPIERSVKTKFDNGESATFNRDEFDLIDHAFAMTVHKAQGGEYDVVILPFIKEFGGMRTKKLLYTAMTRPKKKLIIIGDINSIRYAVFHAAPVRNSYLGYRLKTLFLNGRHPHDMQHIKT